MLFYAGGTLRREAALYDVGIAGVRDFFILKYKSVLQKNIFSAKSCVVRT